jgi:hypothetical protein
MRIETLPPLVFHSSSLHALLARPGGAELQGIVAIATPSPAVTPQPKPWLCGKRKGRVRQRQALVVEVDGRAQRELVVDAVGKPWRDLEELLGGDDRLVARRGGRVGEVHAHARQAAQPHAEAQLVVDAEVHCAGRHHVQVGIALHAVDAAWRVQKAHAEVEAQVLDRQTRPCRPG